MTNRVSGSKFCAQVRHYSFSVMTEAALGITFPVGDSWTRGVVLDYFRSWVSGLFSFGVNLPFTKFGKAMEARRHLIEMIDEVGS